MSEKQDGGPAFSRAGGSNGMTLRDYFAAAAMQGNLAAQSEEFGVYTSDGKSQALLCRESYAIADAMLEARKP